MTLDTGIAVTIVSAGVGAIVWLVRIEGRVNGHDKQIDGMADDLKYIRRRIDSAVAQRGWRDARSLGDPQE